jgi:hypothetical protein
MCKHHYAEYSCGDKTYYRITYCRQQTVYLLEGMGTSCSLVDRVTDKPEKSLCSICQFQRTGIMPERVELEQAYTYDSTNAGS